MAADSAVRKAKAASAQPTEIAPKRSRRAKLAIAKITPDATQASADGAEFDQALLAGFTQAVGAAIAQAHAAGLAVPGRILGDAVEQRPDGRVAPIEDSQEWHPAAWTRS